MLKRILYIMACAVLAVSCSTSKKSLRNTMVGGLTGMEYLEKVIEVSPARNNITAKADVDFAFGDKSPLSFNSNLRIRRGEVIRLSIVPMLGIEVARIDITPDGVLVVDRLHKRYVRAGFKELGGILKTELSFNIIQSLLMNELFLPGKSSLTGADTKSFTLKAEENNIRIDVKNSGNFIYTFHTSPEDGRLEETVIGLKKADLSVRCKYYDFTMLKEGIFPQKIKIYTEGLDKTCSIDMDLSRVGTDSKWDSKTVLSSKYKEIPVSELIKILFKK